MGFVCFGFLFVCLEYDLLVLILKSSTGGASTTCLCLTSLANFSFLFFEGGERGLSFRAILCTS